MKDFFRRARGVAQIVREVVQEFLYAHRVFQRAQLAQLGWSETESIPASHEASSNNQHPSSREIPPSKISAWVSEFVAAMGCSVRCPQRIRSGHRKNLLRTSSFAKAPADESGATVKLQPDRVPGIKTVWRPVNSLPARRPFALVTVVRRSVEAQPGNHCERVALAGVDRDPFAGAGFAIAAKLR